MNVKQKDRRVIVMAEYLFANPAVTSAEITAKFVPEWQLSVRTCRRIMSKAREHNEELIQKHEASVAKQAISSITESAQRAVLSREEALAILSEIANDKNEDGSDKANKASHRDRIAAVSKLADLRGWNAPQKIAETDSQGNDLAQPLTAERKKQILKELEL